MSAASASETPIETKSLRALQREELALAQPFLGRVPWEMVAWGLGNFCVWLALWPLTFSGIFPLWAGFLIATFCVTICYLPSHEAQHSIIGAEGSKLRWLNELVGHVSTIPLVFPYRIAWITHRQHHAHANDPERDPDYENKGDTWWQSAWNGSKARQPGAENGYKRVLEASDDPNLERAFVESTILDLTFYGVLTVCAWSGHAIEAALLWWVPKHFGMTYLQLFLSWAPHYPMEEKGRYRDTRAWRSPVGTILSIGMEYHVIHHLYPKIPLCQTGAAFRAMRGLLEKRDIRNDGL
jgi:beta-carotene hydroxylase